MNTTRSFSEALVAVARRCGLIEGQRWQGPLGGSPGATGARLSDEVDAGAVVELVVQVDGALISDRWVNA